MNQSLDSLIGDVLIVFALLFGALDVWVYFTALRRVRGLRRAVYLLILFIAGYALAVYSLSLLRLLPDGAELLSFLLRPVLVGLLGFLATLGIMDRRR